MLRTEYNEAETLDRLKKDYLEQGKEIGLEQGKEIGLEQGLEQGIEIGFKKGEIQISINLVKNHLLSLTNAAQQLNMTEDKFQSYIENPELLNQI